jgi:mono/diheme cytochrome c family protein
MPSAKVSTLFAVAVLFGLTPALVRAAEPSSADMEFFEKKVRPVLVANCFKCHGEGKTKGGLSLASRDGMLKGGDSGPVIVPGDPAKSPLVQAIRYEGETRMPPKQKLAERDIAELIAWVRRGAPWPTASSGGAAIRSGGDTISAADRAFCRFGPSPIRRCRPSRTGPGRASHSIASSWRSLNPAACIRCDPPTSPPCCAA